MQFPKLLGGQRVEKPQDETREQKQAPQRLDFGELLCKLEAAESRIRDMLSATAPEVKVQLPRFSATSFEADAGYSGAGGSAAFTALLISAPEVPDVEMGTGAQRLLQVEGNTTAQERPAVTLGALAGLARQLRAPLLAASASLALVVAAAFAGVGPLPATLAAAVASASGSACTLHARASSARAAVMEHLEVATAEVLEVLRSTKSLVVRLSKQVIEAADNITEEQRPALDKIKEFESTLEVDIPDPSDLKKPFIGSVCKALWLVGQIEDAVPPMVQELASKTTVGKVAMDAQFFLSVAVVLPSLAVLALNVSLAMAQLTISAVDRSTKEVATATVPTHQAWNVMLGEVPEVDWVQYLHPWAAQMVLMLAQLAAIMLLSQGSRICGFVNSMIVSVEDETNVNINESIATAVGQICGQAFQEVAHQCDLFFPKFKEVLRKLEQAMELAERAEALAGNANKLKSMVKW